MSEEAIIIGSAADHYNNATYDASNPDHAEAQKNYAEWLQQLKRTDVLKVLSSPEGRRFLWNLLIECGTFQTPFYGNSRDVFDLGRRRIGNFLLTLIIEARGFAVLDLMKAEFEEQLQEGGHYIADYATGQNFYSGNSARVQKRSKNQSKNDY